MGLFEVARWKKSLTANVRLSRDVNSMAMLARFESSWTGASHRVYPTLRTHLSCGAGTVARSGCSFMLSHGHIHKRLKRHTNAHFLCPPLSSSAFLSVYLPVLYICHIGIPPMQLVPVPIPRYLSEKCSSKHFTLAYAKGKWQRQVCDRQRTACAQGCHWQNQDHCLPSLLLSH